MEEIYLHELSEPQQTEVRSLLKPYESMWSGKLVKVKGALHRIETGKGARPPVMLPYRAGPHKRKVFETEEQKMLDNCVIEPSQSPSAAPVVLAPKKDGGWRFCVDYRRLNSIAIKDEYPSPRLDDCIDSL